MRTISLTTIAATGLFLAAAAFGQPNSTRPRDDAGSPRPEPDRAPATSSAKDAIAATSAVSGTITAYEPGRKIAVETVEGERTFDLASTSVNVPSRLTVGERVTVTKSILSDGRVSITVDRVR